MEVLQVREVKKGDPWWHKRPTIYRGVLITTPRYSSAQRVHTCIWTYPSMTTVLTKTCSLMGAQE